MSSQKIEFQLEYNAMLDKEKALKEEKAELVKKFKKHGFFMLGNIVTEQKKVVGYITNWAFYSRYVGEVGAMYDYESNAHEFDHDFYEVIAEFKRLKEFGGTVQEYTAFFDKFDEAFAEGFNYPLKDSPEQSYFLNRCKKVFKDFSYNDVTNELKFSYSDGGGQCEFDNGSGFVIKEMTVEEIKGYKSDNRKGVID